MKHVIKLIILMISCYNSLNAQDIIITKEAQKIEAQVCEISLNDVKYKAWDNLNGPLYILPQHNIVTIIYENGKVELFGDSSKFEKPSSNNMEINEERKCIYMAQPSRNFKQEGIVVINIVIDVDGNVISAKVDKGSTVTDSITKQLAIRAARECKFTKGNSIQTSTITYIFKFK